MYVLTYVCTNGLTEGVASELGALAALARRRRHVRPPLDTRLDVQLGEPAWLHLVPAVRRAGRLRGARVRRLSSLVYRLARLANLGAGAGG